MKKKLLKETAQRFRKITELTKAGCLLCAPQGLIYYVSPHITQLLGWETGELYYRNLSEFCHPDDYRPLIEAQKTVEKISGYHCDGTFQLRHATGKWLSVSVSMHNLTDDVDIKAVIYLLTDVNAPKNSFFAKAGNELVNTANSAFSSSSSIITHTKVTEERYRAAADSGFDSFIILRPVFEPNQEIIDFEFVDLNKNAEDLFQLNALEVKGLSWLNNINIEAGPYLFNEFRKVSISRQPIQNEYKISLTDTKHLWINYQIIPLSDGVAITIRDISPYKIAEEQIKETSEKYQLLFECNPLPMWVFDLESHRFMAVNEAAIAYYGYTWEEFMYMTIQDIIPNEDRHLINSYYQHQLKINHPAGTWRHHKKNGDIIFVEITSHPLIFEGKHARLVLANDITEKKKAEQELRKSEASLFSLLENTNKAIWSLDLNYNIVTANSAFENEFFEIFGVHATIGQNYLDCIPFKSIGNFKKNTFERAIKGEMFTLERTFTVDGKQRYFEIHVNPIIENGNISGISLFADHVTDRKELEDSIRDIAISLSSTSGNEFFRSLVSYLSQKLQSDFVFVGRLNKQTLKIDTIAFYNKGIQDENYKVSLNDPVCLETLDKKEIFTCADNSYIYYPSSTLINNLRISGFIATPLLNSYGEELGLLIIMNQKPISRPGLSENILRIFAIRAAAELERLHAEDTISQNQANLKALVENAQEAIWSVDYEMNLTVCNTAFKQLFYNLMGKHVELGMYLTSFLPEYHRKYWLDKFQKAIRGERQSLEEQYVINGRKTIFEVNISPIVRDTGVINGVSFFAKDVTEKRIAIETIRNSEQQYRNLIENMTEGVLYANSAGELEFANEQFYNMLGYKVEELSGKNIYDFIFSADEANIIKEKISIQNEDISDSFKLELKRKSGEHIWVNIHGTPLIDDNGNNIGSISTITDITERKITEERVKESEKRYRNLVNTMHEGILYLNDEKIIQFANPRFCTMLGYKEEELINQKLIDIVQNKDLEKHILDCFSEPDTEVEKTETQLKRKNGSEIWVLVNSSLQKNEDNELIGLLNTLTDISDQKYAEEKLKVINQELNTFVYKSSHDLKGPLSSIIGLTDLANREISDVTAKQYIDMIKQGAGRLDKILMDLLDTIKIKEGSISTNDINFTEMMGEILISMEHCLNYDRLKFTTDISQKGKFFSDKKILTSVLQNLIDNSIKYQDTNKPNSFVSITIKDEKNGIKVEIEDNGLGIMKGAQDKVFNMFYRANLNSKGTGLGLYIVKNAIEKLGGHIDLISSEGVGSRFIIFVPNAIPVPEPILN